MDAKGPGTARALEELKFDNLVLRALPLDKVKENYPRSPVEGACFSLADPTPIEEPALVSASLDALGIIDIDPKQVDRNDFAEYFCGNKILNGGRPAAHCYCGHQFGYFSGQLGDGATMYLGEVLNSKNERWELQFKGAGRTPYSRTADGRKVLRSSIREYLCSEAMAGLGIPTTRAPTCVTSKKTKVVRDVFNDGNPVHEQCTVITRLARTFLRFGSFEIVKPKDPTTKRAGPSAGRADVLKSLLDHTIKTYFPAVWARHEEEEEEKRRDERRYLDFYTEVVKRTARLVAKWQCVGWCHGVLNTDNISIIGITIDYGPYGFMERTSKEYICNASDNDGRYSYGNQPEMCKWNCLKLAEAMQLALDLESSKKALEDTYDKEFKAAYYKAMKGKLGLESEDTKLVDDLLETMEETGSDFTLTFRTLSTFVRQLGQSGSGFDIEKFTDGFVGKALAPYQEILESLQPKMATQEIHMLVMMARQNPFLLQRFPQLMSDLKKIDKRREFLQKSEEKFDEDNRAKWKAWFSRYAAKVSEEAKTKSEEKGEGQQSFGQILSALADSMDTVNPKYILRNYMLQDAIEKAEKHDYSGVNGLLQLVRNPFEENPKDVTGIAPEKLKAYNARPPKEAATICVT